MLYLPTETVHEILQHLELKDLLRFFTINRKYLSLMTSRDFWCFALRRKSQNQFMKMIKCIFRHCHPLMIEKLSTMFFIGCRNKIYYRERQEPLIFERKILINEYQRSIDSAPRIRHVIEYLIEDFNIFSEFPKWIREDAGVKRSEREKICTCLEIYRSGNIAAAAEYAIKNIYDWDAMVDQMYQMIGAYKSMENFIEAIDIELDLNGEESPCDRPYIIALLSAVRHGNINFVQECINSHKWPDLKQDIIIQRELITLALLQCRDNRIIDLITSEIHEDFDVDGVMLIWDTIKIRNAGILAAKIKTDPEKLLAKSYKYISPSNLNEIIMKMNDNNLRKILKDAKENYSDYLVYKIESLREIYTM